MINQVFQKCMEVAMASRQLQTIALISGSWLPMAGSKDRLDKMLG